LTNLELAAHNSYRAKHQAPALVIDAALTTAAQKYANLLRTSIKTLKHSPAAISGTYG